MEKNFSLSMKKRWTDEQEQLLIMWAEKASGYGWMHNKSIQYFRRMSLYISIPASIFGYVAGTATFLSNNLDNNQLLRGIIGLSGIIAGLLTNFQEIFPFKEKSEKHKISSLRFLSFFREINCELSMEAQQRHAPIEYVNLKRLELDKMLEQSPTIPVSIITLFNNTFREIRFEKPDIANGVQTIIPFGAPKVMYMKRINLEEKILLLSYFSSWKQYTEKAILEKKNSALNTFVSTKLLLSNRNYIYSHLHAPLTKQKKLLQFQNIKINVV